MNIKNELIEYSELHYSNLAIKIINLFYFNITTSSLYHINLRKIMTNEEIKILINIFGEQYKRDFYSGLYYKHNYTHESELHYPYVKEENSYYLSVYRTITKRFYPNTIINDELDVLIIFLSKIKSDFFGYNTNPNNFNQQKQIIENLLGQYCFKN